MADKKVWAGLIGLLDPVLIRLAHDLAATIPQDSVLRSQLFESLTGAARGFIEAHTEKYPLLASLGIEKLTDLSEFLSASLKGNSPSDLSQNFMAIVAKRLRKAEDPRKEAARIKEELSLLKEIADMTQDKKDPAYASVVPAIETLNRKLETIRDRLKKPNDSINSP